MGKKPPISPLLIEEVEDCGKIHYMENPQKNVYIFDNWLFIWPRKQKWHDKYSGAYGFYLKDHLEEFLDNALNEYKLTGQYIHGGTNPAQKIKLEDGKVLHRGKVLDE